MKPTLRIMNFKKLLFLPLIIFALIQSCQTEETEITNPPEEDIIEANSTIANLMSKTTSNDGSVDNILDYANCLEVVLPVTIAANGVTITIESSTDYNTLETLLDAFADDGDEIVFTFPITVTLNDYTEIVINNQAELETQIELCNGENEDDDDIECIDFLYPISVSIYNSNFQVTETVVIEDDETLYNFVNDIEGGVLASLNFPITMVLSNGNTVIVNSNQELEAAITDAEDNCDEDDDYDWNDDDFECSEDAIELVLVECLWDIAITSPSGLTSYEDAEFTSNGVLNNQFGGDWWLEVANGEIILNIDTNSAPLTGSWVFAECTNDELVLINGNQTMVLEQDCDSNNPFDCFEDADAEISACDGDIVDGFAEFDLTTGFPNCILPAISTMSYHVTESDAVANMNSIATPSNFINTVVNLQTIYARVGLTTNPDAYEVYPITLIVNDCCDNPGVLLNDLIIYMPFAEEAHDLISGFNAQSITNTFIEDRSGNSLCAMAFTGNDTFEIPINGDNQLIQGDSFSISVWFKMQNTDAGDLEMIFRSPGNATQGFQLGVYDLNTPLFSDNSNFNLWDNDWNGEVDVEWVNTDWHHLVVTVDANNTVKLYRDGIQRNVTENSTLNIGSQPASAYIIGEGFVGHLDDLRVYKKTLNPNEVNTLFTLNGECYNCL
ncbi:LamG domain-containing protein [Lacinutrix algicola]|uniref:LamG domain-containing protein n=1 Tax=Lacinutrix algicola TaxID=342954 RepID=UPI0006E3265B|nr:LamG domain-containing protein [Lacinutrix algicola]